MYYIAYDPALFINEKRNVAESHTEDREYLCCFHLCNEILKRLYEIFETSKKQDLTPPGAIFLRGFDELDTYRIYFSV